ncbi:Hypothetical protein SRAE_2000266900 [Strongyloides ratti]|uniref:Uncharacterized protein n=1 Tax=Strongyloides ratti TaxID=34506 RepID=A0A090LIQ1_STRRB|nr:Hypothetical protein SRAE_2000266900 [Strongyloides ratti]CEF68008.1 Hypothetical protein SRAE_2000266900 [Strongyloides ratti]
MNSFQLDESVTNESKAVEFLQKHGLIPDSKKCENGHEMKLSFGKVIRWRCSLRSCRKQIGVRVGTWFQGTKMPLKTAILFIYFWANKESSGERMKKKLDLSPSTTVDWNSLLREVCVFMEKQEDSNLERKEVTVEVDKTNFAQRSRDIHFFYEFLCKK